MGDAFPGLAQGAFLDQIEDGSVQDGPNQLDISGNWDARTAGGCRIAVGIALFYAMASLNTSGMLAWLSTILKDSGMGLDAAAAAFSGFTFMTLLMAFVVPIVTARHKHVFSPACWPSSIRPGTSARAGVGEEALGQLGYGGLEDADVVVGAVRAGVAGPQPAGKNFPGAVTCTAVTGRH